MSDSTWDDPRITSYVLDELSAEQRDAFELELDSNSELAAAVAEASSLTDRIGSLFESESTPSLDDARKSAIADTASNPLSSLSNAEQGEAIHGAPSWGVPMMVLAMAAVLLLLVGFAPWIRQNKVLTASGPEEESAMASSVASSAPTASEKAGSVPAAADFAFAKDGAGQQVELSLSKEAPSGTAIAALADGDDARKAGMESAMDVAQESVQGKQMFELAEGGRQSETVDRAIPTASSLGLPDLDALTDSEQEALTGRATALSAAAGTASDGVSESDGSSSPKRSAMQRARARIAENMGSIAARSDKTPAPAPMKKPAAVVEPESAMAPPAVAAQKSIAKSARPNRSMSRSAPAGAAALSAPANEVSVEDQPMTAQDELLFRDIPKETSYKNDAKTEEVKPAGGVAFAAGGVMTRADKASADKGFDEEILELNQKLFGQNQFGRGGIGGKRSMPVFENPFVAVTESPLSTFATDVDTSSYSLVRRELLRAGALPDAGEVRVEELVNYFHYDYWSDQESPADKPQHPFAAQMTVASCPWNSDHQLVRVVVKGESLDQGKRPPCNLVFLLDTSGSMDAPNKLSLIADAIRSLVEQLDEKDRLAIVVFSDAEGLVLDSTPVSEKKSILDALADLSDGGSTTRGEGIDLAFKVAKDNLVDNGVNRVVVCTDGDFSAGMDSIEKLSSRIEKESAAGISFAILALGQSDYAQARPSELVAQGEFAFVDSIAEAKQVMSDQTSRRDLVADDVTLKLEFNPRRVSQYRLIGFENERIGLVAKTEGSGGSGDSRSNRILAGRSVTALYEIVPQDEAEEEPSRNVEKLKYQKEPRLTKKARSDELLSVGLSYRLPGEDADEDEDADEGEDADERAEFSFSGDEVAFADADADFRFAATVAHFGMQLRDSKYLGDWTLKEVLPVAETSLGRDPFGLREEFLQVIRRAESLVESK
ncbi:YfbK domain-containing protein [Planctomycetes bacterium K23_9]|uniref:von Willebrand factor n=1 Tax=Stieleria marina TaxID=1930275 RepID=A0A517NZI6_9BACT|nr:von Willebrand factor [Planctomycetes bacterium K23_9]